MSHEWTTTSPRNRQVFRNVGLSQVIVGIFFCHFFESEFNTPGDTLGT